MKLAIRICVVCIFVLCTATRCEEDDGEYTAMDVDLVEIELFNIDNSGRGPVLAKDSVKKEAYVVGVRYKVVDTQNADDTIHYYNENKVNYDKEVIVNTDLIPRIFTNTDFDEDHPAGSDVTDLFLSTDWHTGQSYDRMLILRKAPEAGIHSFKVSYTLLRDGIAQVVTSIDQDTSPIKLY